MGPLRHLRGPFFYTVNGILTKLDTMTHQNRRSAFVNKWTLTILALLATTLTASVAHAQSTMVIDGNCSFTMSTSTSTPAVQINPTTGNVTVNSQTGVACSPASVTLSVPTPVQVNQSFTVSWTSTGTTTCNTSGGTAGWFANGRPSSGSVNLTAPSSAQTVAFNISCVTGGTPVTDSKNITFDGTAATVNLITPASAPVSQPFTISWTSTGTTGCTPTGGTGTNWSSQGALPVSGNRSITAPASATTVTFGITCSSSGGNVSDSEQTTFTGGGGGANCDSVTLPPGIGGFGQQTWTTLYGGQQFPLIYSSNKTFAIGSGQGLRLAITPTLPTNGSSPNGTLTYNEADSVARAGFMTISRCPGDFRLNVLNLPAGCDGVFTPCTTKCHTGIEAQGQLSLGFRLQGTANNTCNMTPGAQYYVNIHFGGTSTPGPEGAFCAGSQCRIIGGTQEFLSREGLALEWLEGDLLGLSDRAPLVVSYPITPDSVQP